VFKTLKKRPSRTVIVTGGTAGVGRAIARAFAKSGDRVGVIAREARALEELREELTGLGAECATEAIDVADAGAVFAAAQRLEARLGKIDVWINDAMETVFSTVAELSPEEFRRVTEVTYLGFVYGTMAALRAMRPRRRGRIIQIGSALAYRGIPLQAAYCGAKHAIRGFTDSLRAELLHERSDIRISIVELPAVNTPQFDWARVHLPRTPRPMGRPVEPEAVADAVLRAASGSWREYWLGFPTIVTILANAVVPAYLDRYLARTAFEGQQTGTTVAADRRDNLEHPVSGLHRTRGSFGSESKMRAPLVAGEPMRLAAFATGAFAFMAIGVGIATLFRTPPRRAARGWPMGWH
jgi:NAD(P)-dependent dehydrogenase (short-subunit alcohol dehydrogenase family)